MCTIQIYYLTKIGLESNMDECVDTLDPQLSCKMFENMCEYSA